MKEDLESPLPIVIIKEWVWIAMENILDTRPLILAIKAIRRIAPNCLTKIAVICTW